MALEATPQVREVREECDALRDEVETSPGNWYTAIDRCHRTFKLLRDVERFAMLAPKAEQDDLREELTCAREQLRAALSEQPQYSGAQIVNVRSRLQAALAIAAYVLRK